MSRRVVHLLVAALAMPLVVGAAPASAAPSSHRASTCGQGTATVLTLAKPSGTAPDDVLIASIGTANGTATPTAPAGWAQVPGLSGIVNADQRLVTFYKVATATEPASYAFGGGTTIDGMTGGISSFSGVDTVVPIAGTPGQVVDASINTGATLPNSSGTAAGSMRYSAVAMDDAGNQTFSTGLTRVCNEVNGAGTDVALATGWEPTGAGTTATRSVTRDDNGRSIMHTLVLMRACGAGGLNLSAPATVSFGTTTLDGTDQSVAATPIVGVNDQTGVEAGWSLTATSTTFTNGTHELPTDAATLTSVGPAAGAGRCAAPTNSVTLPVTVPAAATAPAATKLFNAAAGTGMGSTDLALGLELAIPGHARVGSYASTWTLSLISGP